MLMSECIPKVTILIFFSFSELSPKSKERFARAFNMKYSVKAAPRYKDVMWDIVSISISDTTKKKERLFYS